MHSLINADKELPFRLVWVKQRPTGDDVTVAADVADVENAENALLPPSTVEAPWGPTNVNGSDYTEPLAVPDDDVVGIALVADITGPAVAVFQPRQIDVRISPFKLHVKIPGFKPVSVYFPCAVAPPTVASTVRRPDGFVHRLEYCVHVRVDRTPWDAQVDAGSKPWLVAQALTMDEGGGTSSSSSSGGSGGGVGDEDMSVYGGHRAAPVTRGDGNGNDGDDDFRRGTGDDAVGDDDLLPEDRFHLNLPKNVDKYTGAPLDGADDELPEDRFHKKDASSQFLINQREQSAKDKWSKHEKEKAERLNDPNIEYVDIDEYKPGGKYGGPLEAEAAKAAAAAQAVKEELQKAAEVVAKAANDTEIGSMLQSKLWTELLD